MSEPNDRDQAPPDPPPSGAARTPSFRSALRGLRRAASEVAETGAEEARKLAEAARPEIERRAKQARAAAEAARPVLEEKAREATGYVREHQDEIVRASKRGAEVAASGAARAVTPRPLRPALDAMARELRDPPAEDAVDLEDGRAGTSDNNAAVDHATDPTDPTDPSDPTDLT